MITGRVEVRVNRAEMRSQLTRDTLLFTREVVAAIAVRARQLAPRDSGNLRRRINPDPPRAFGTRVTSRVVADTPYAIYQHEGTGVYGPRRARIRPTRRRALRFRWKKVGAVVFFRSVAGTRPTKFLVRAVDEVLSSPPWRVVYYTTLI